MGAFGNLLTSIKNALVGITPFGGTIWPTSEDFPVADARTIKAATYPVPTLEALADIPYSNLAKDMEVIVSEHALSGGTIHPRTKYYLRQMPPENTRVNEVSGYVLSDYWIPVPQGQSNFEGTIETQYAPSFEGKRPKFLPTEISSEAYQAGYPTDAAYTGGNTSDIIWANEFDPTLNHVWFRQRSGSTLPWGIPVSLSAGGDYEANQYIDVIFRWVDKNDPAPGRPIQPADYLQLPTGWLTTPGDDYETRILTENLYRSQSLRNPYGILKSEWDIPILVSDDPILVRYGNTPGNTDFLNDTFWRGYYTPGLDTHMASRTSSSSSNWTISKIDQESGEFDDFVFKAFPIGVTQGDLTSSIPTLPIPVGGASPNDWSDASPDYNRDTHILYMSKCTKYSDGSFKTAWSFPRRFDGLDAILAVLDATPGDIFYEVRNSSGNLEDNIASIDITAKLFKGVTELTTGFTEVKWFRGTTEIVFDEDTRYAINLGVNFNAYHQVSADGKSLKVFPLGINTSQQYTTEISHTSNPSAPYSANILLRDAKDDASAFVADILSVHGNTFRNHTGLYKFDGQFIKGGVLDTTDVSFKWTLLDSTGAAITNGIKKSDGTTLGTSDVEAASAYISGSSISTYAVLKVVAQFGEITREDRVTLTDLADAVGLEILYWGNGSSDPGNPTDFTPRTLTKSEVLALNINYFESGTNAWFCIIRENGVWGGEIRLRSESARPNGGINLFIFKNVEESVDGIPTAPAIPSTGSLIPTGWTISQTARTGGQDATYMCSAFFLLRTDVAADPATLTRVNYNPLSSSYGDPNRVNGDTPPPAVSGNNGWSPIIANIVDNQRVVEKVIDWVGGQGTKPAANTDSSYVGSTGLTTLANAVDKRGPSGPSTNMRPQQYAFSGLRATLPTVAMSESSGHVFIRRLTFQNTHNASRMFRVFATVGFVKFSTTGDPALILVRIRYKPGDNPDSDWTSISLTTADENKVGVTEIQGSDFRGRVIPVEAMISVPANEFMTIYLSAERVAGGASYRNSGFIEAWGI